MCYVCDNKNEYPQHDSRKRSFLKLAIAFALGLAISGAGIILQCGRNSFGRIAFTPNGGTQFMEVKQKNYLIASAILRWESAKFIFSIVACS